MLTPGVEVGLRHAGLDAETGFGAEAGLNLVLADEKRGIGAKLRAKGLVTPVGRALIAMPERAGGEECGRRSDGRRRRHRPSR